ncbi:glucose-1-phosphate adenylyltransferase [Alienimonas californiensis]|uniref:Glucose-1-phosphate adenylyltransferase n=1 Tax=Alienimonas californiensis TaxID=2527989 RepID=A0A517P7Q8_9PLAN|nr:glucose-1-phosphate adenylyltransferase [Alienimonas californiensis]QDT15393.1 Glucose-1-phosphate adenylyltransferase [Alienimonas californiensis]
MARSSLISLILGGGKGTRLFPLTELRSKPAVPLAGKFRLIDIPISNCLNSGLEQIYLLTQFNSVSLHRHIRESYKFDRFGGGFVEILAAQQSQDEAEHDWYQGTADAVRKNLRYIEQHGVKHVLILSGDQLYRMNYAKMLATHKKAKADVTIGALPVTRQQARGFGIMTLNDDGRVTDFTEKPQTDAAIDAVRTDPAWMDAHGIKSNGRDCLGSMGIYLFDRDVLVELLKADDAEDFGKEVFPRAIQSKHVQAHLFDGYWEDIGTIRSFYESNLALAGPNPPFDFADAAAPIYTQSRYLPSSRIGGGTITGSLISDGCIIGKNCTIENSVIGLRSYIGDGVTIRNSVVMGADFYQEAGHREDDFAAGRPPVGVGDGSTVDGSIVDKNCRIGRNIHFAPPAPAAGARYAKDADYNWGVLRDGILVLPKNTELPDGWTPDSDSAKRGVEATTASA